VVYILCIFECIFLRSEIAVTSIGLSLGLSSPFIWIISGFLPFVLSLGSVPSYLYRLWAVRHQIILLSSRLYCCTNLWALDSSPQALSCAYTYTSCPPSRNLSTHLREQALRDLDFAPLLGSLHPFILTSYPRVPGLDTSFPSCPRLHEQRLARALPVALQSVPSHFIFELFVDGSIAGLQEKVRPSRKRRKRLLVQGPLT